HRLHPGVSGGGAQVGLHHGGVLTLEGEDDQAHPGTWYLVSMAASRRPIEAPGAPFLSAGGSTLAAVSEKMVGRVLGPKDATPMEFWVGVSEGEYLQLDDVVALE